MPFAVHRALPGNRYPHERFADQADRTMPIWQCRRGSDDEAEVLSGKCEVGGFTPGDGERRLSDRLLAKESDWHKQFLYQVVTKQPIRIFGGSLSCTQFTPSSKELLAGKGDSCENASIISAISANGMRVVPG